MNQPGARQRVHGPIALAEFVGRVIDPITARRGFAAAELVSGWAEIVGARYADCSRPDRIAWPRGKANEDKPGTLVVVVDGPRALLLQHEADQIVERTNNFLGHGTIGRIKIIQGTVSAPSLSPGPENAPLAEEDQAKLAEALCDVESVDLRSALNRLGRAILAEGNKKT